MSSGSCACYCCTGRGCTRALIISFQSSSADCQASTCSARYSQCSISPTVGGSVSAQYLGGNNSNSNYNSSSSNIPLIICVIVGGLVLVSLIGGYVWWKRRKQQSAVAAPPTYPQTGPVIQNQYPPTNPQIPPQTHYQPVYQNQPQYQPPYQNQSSGMSNVAAGGLGLAGGLVGGALLSNALRPHRNSFGSHSGFNSSQAGIPHNSTVTYEPAGFNGTSAPLGYASEHIYAEGVDSNGNQFHTDTVNYN